MYRWLAYSGNPVQMETVLFRPWHPLIDQSLRSRLGGETTANGDGFGTGRYGRYSEVPFRYRYLHLAWNDTNLREAARAIRSSMFIAYVRAATDTPAQGTNCHPFRYGRWLFAHNGLIREYPLLCRALMMEVAPELFRWIEGSTDSEIMFLLALSFGLDHDPCGALEQMVGLIEDIGCRHGVEYPLNMMVCAMDGAQTVTARYSSEGESCSLFYSTSFKHLHQLYPDSVVIEDAGDDVLLMLSRPLVDLSGVWAGIPEGTVVIVKGGVVEHYRFVPYRPGPTGFDLPANQVSYGREAGWCAPAGVIQASPRAFLPLC